MTATPPARPAPPAEPAPRTTSHNEPTYAGAPIGGAELTPAIAAEGRADGARGAPPRTGPLRESSARYQLIAPPSYENIVGGAAPSPIVSLFFVVGIAALLGAALLTGLGQGGPEWWLFGALFVVIATTLAGFVSRTAG